MVEPTVSAGLNPPREWLPPFPDDEEVVPQSLRVADGPTPLFGDSPRWDCTAMGLAPNQSRSRAHLRFDVYSGLWLPVAKTLAMVLLNPTHPVLRKHGIYLSNRPAKLKTVIHSLNQLRYLADWADTTGRSARLSDWTADDCTAYLDTVRGSSGPSRLCASEDILRLLHTYGVLLESGGLQVLIPKSKVGRVRSEVKTPVIPPDVFWPLVKACWAYIDVIAPDLLAARDEIGYLESARDAVSIRRTTGTVDMMLDDWLSDPKGFVPLQVINCGQGKAGEINWDGLAVRLAEPCRPLIFYGPQGPNRKRRVQHAIASGLQARPGLTVAKPVDVDRPDGTRGPWCPGFDRPVVRRELTNLRNAIYMFVMMMTMMRDSEVQGIPVGSLSTRYGAPVVRSTLHKKQGPGGKPETWWVSEPVVKAIQLAEKITLDDSRIFGSVLSSGVRNLNGFDVHEQIGKFIGWVNAHSPENGLDRIPEFHISPHMFRRTMAVITANEPDGEIALGITLKHNATRALANSVTSGYGAPTPAWVREFDHESKNAVAGELVAEWSQHADGERIARGPGATAYLEGLDAITKKAPTTSVPVGDERMLRDMLRDEFSTIRLGTLNHCLGAAEKAECLRNVSDQAKAGGPIPSLCSPSTCRNSVITDKHMPIWLNEEAELVKRLKDRRMAPVHRARLEVQLGDVRRITTQEPK